MLIAIDFETKPILPRPEYPPVPVGVAIYPESKDPFYLAWGHPSENNTTFDDARARLCQIWSDPSHELVFHNAQFDVDVAETHMRMPELPWNRLHCTQIMAFLAEPEAKTTALKVLAHEHLGMEPEEQDELFAWIRNHVPEARRKKKVGAWISYAPGKLVGKYAVGDVVRTLQLYDHFFGWIKSNDVTPAYDRERKLVRTVLAMERRGVPINAPGVSSALEDCERGVEAAEKWLAKKLGTGFNLNSGEELADRLEELGYVNEGEWHRTWTKRRQTSIPSLQAVMPRHRNIVDALRYRSLMTTIHNQLGHWGTGDLMYTQWNTTRRSKDGGSGTAGARTGRLSSSPNYQNIPARIPRIASDQGELEYLEGKGLDAVGLYGFEWKHAPAIPHPRELVVAPDGCSLVNRDYSQQELRILAHFAGHGLARRYREHPDTDMHAFAKDEIKRLFDMDVPRGPVKAVGFGILYGQSVGATAAGLGQSFEETQQLRRAYLSALDGVKQLQAKLKQRAACDESFRTWGGRLYWCEEPGIVQGSYRTFEYKMLNTLIQGSAADHMKETLVRAHESQLDLLLTVHDEVLVQSSEECALDVDQALKNIMEEIEFDVPMRSDGKIGNNWEECK